MSMIYDMNHSKSEYDPSFLNALNEIIKAFDTAVTIEVKIYAGMFKWRVHVREYNLDIFSHCNDLGLPCVGFVMPQTVVEGTDKIEQFEKLFNTAKEIFNRVQDLENSAMAAEFGF